MRGWIGSFGGIALPWLLACGPTVADVATGDVDDSSGVDDPSVGVTLTTGAPDPDGTTEPGDPSDPSDTMDSTGPGSSCGDGVVDEGEECDDVAGCEEDCRWSPGKLLWSQSIDGGAGISDMGTSIVVDGAGTIYAAGALQQGALLDAWVGAFDPAGNRLHENSFDLGADEIASSVIVDTAGTVWVTGSDLENVAFLLRDDGGTLVQVGDLLPHELSWPALAVASPTGGFFTSRQEYDLDEPGAWSYVIDAHASDGTVTWTSQDSPDALVLALAATPGGGVVLAGQVQNEASHLQVWLRELSEDGTVLWTFDDDFPDYDDESAHTVMFTADGRLLAGGRREIPGFGYVPFVAELDPGGALVDLREISVGDASFWLYALLDDPNGLVIGGTAYPVSTPSDAVVAALDGTGSLLWGVSYDDALGFNDSTRALARDPSTGDIVAVGTDVGMGQADNLWLARVRG